MVGKLLQYQCGLSIVVSCRGGGVCSGGCGVCSGGCGVCSGGVCSGGMVVCAVVVL